MIELIQTSKFNIFNPTNKKLLFTLETLDQIDLRQFQMLRDLESIFGKTVLIDLKTKEYKVFRLAIETLKEFYTTQSTTFF